MRTAAVLGAGSWGTALAVHLHRTGHDVRLWGRDADLAQSAGVDLLFAPVPEEVYPPGFATTVEVARLSAPLEGAMRGPAHFRGVATVVTKLLNMVQPDDAFFGQKDAQQALIILRLVQDLDLPVRIEVCPTVREADGLAMSSRNVRLDPESRRRAPAIARALHEVEARVGAGERDLHHAIHEAGRILGEAGIDPEYFEAVSADTLDPVAHLDGRTLVAIAARVGDVRLIDNVIVSPPAAS